MIAAVLTRLVPMRMLALVAALLASHGAAWWHGYDTRRDADAARVASALAAQRIATARVIGLAEAQAATAAERDRLREDLDHAAIADPDAGRVCLGADSLRRLGAP